MPREEKNMRPVKKKNKLSLCSYCKRPSILLSWDLDVKKGKREFVPYQDKTTHPNIEKWCDGSCDAVVIPLIILISDAKEIKTKTEREKKLIVWYNKQLRQAVKLLEKVLLKRDCLK
jgi:hypothetical protein